MKTFNFKFLLLVVALLANSQGHTVGFDFFMQKAKNAVTQSVKNTCANASTCAYNGFIRPFRDAPDAYAFAQANPGQAAKIMAQTAASVCALFTAEIVGINYMRNTKLNSCDLAVVLSLSTVTTIPVTIVILAQKQREAAWVAQQQILSRGQQRKKPVKRR